MSSSNRNAWPRPFVPRIAAGWSYRLHSVLARSRPLRWLAANLERSPRGYRVFTAAERVVKEQLYGCRMCGQCALPTTGYACPMTCPKQLRNGPCGGVSPTGACEVHPQVRCVWLLAHDQAEGHGHGADLDLLQRPVDHREQDRSSWVNYWLGRDDDLCAEPAGTARRAPLLPIAEVRSR